MPIDYSEYPPTWFTEIRPRIMRRAGEVRCVIESGDSIMYGEIVKEARCEWCGAENHRPHPETGSPVVLTIAHLDHDKGNCDVADDRLRALCQACHLRYDAPRHHEKRRAGLDAERGQLQLIDRAESMRMVEQHHYPQGEQREGT